MKRRMKKMLINQPTDLDDIELNSFDDGSYADWDTIVGSTKSHRFKELRKSVSSMHIRHSNKH
jgi:hypothetical protein